jgi:hypothetical protein
MQPVLFTSMQDACLLVIFTCMEDRRYFRHHICCSVLAPLAPAIMQQGYRDFKFLQKSHSRSEIWAVFRTRPTTVVNALGNSWRAPLSGQSSVATLRLVCTDAMWFDWACGVEYLYPSSFDETSCLVKWDNRLDFPIRNNNDEGVLQNANE